MAGEVAGRSACICNTVYIITARVLYRYDNPGSFEDLYSDGLYTNVLGTDASSFP